ncbi:MAG: ABC transporter ATP-binding protein [Saprospiraceae bacterium]|nr:ABC transporter ATP-binding protein [Saprospiraceae bacterium]
MIKIKGVDKFFGKDHVLNNVQLTFDRGKCIGIIGPNGCGKTTMMKCILGLVVPTKGKIFFNDIDISGSTDYRNDIGYMPQIGRYPENMTIGNIIIMLKNLRQYKHKLDEQLFFEFGLDKMLDKKLGTLSGGTTQKLSATLAFLFDPKVLILDEPTAGLDPLSSELLRFKILKEVEKGKLILITSHLLSELDDLITEVVFMQDGNVKFHHHVNELMALTGQQKISNSIASILKKYRDEQNN